MKKSYQLLPLVGVNQAPNQFANVYVVVVVIVDTPTWMIRRRETSVRGAISWLFVNTRSVGDTLNTAVCGFVCRSVRGAIKGFVDRSVGRPFRPLVGGSIDRSIADVVGCHDICFCSVLSQSAPRQGRDQPDGHGRKNQSFSGSHLCLLVVFISRDARHYEDYTVSSLEAC